MAEPESTDAIPPATAERRLRDGFRVVVIRGPDRGRVLAAARPAMTIGTDAACDLQLGCRAVSRFHCEIEIGDRGAVITDLDSTNGTRVDGVRVVAAFLRGGTQIEVGRDVLRFENHDAQVGPELFAGEQFGAMVGRSPAMRAVFAVLARAAVSDATVLLCGETGTGKDAAAEAIHLAGARASQPLVYVDCAAIARGVADSELFGHRAGAFTGAHRDRIGAFESAGGGTIFLDEVGELSLGLQQKLLRALERREIQRIGETVPRPFAARVIAATHRDLRREVNTGRFRPDLYFRLAVLPIGLPPLRERLDDLPLLVESLIERITDDATARTRLRATVSPAELARRDWPGNVRQLRNHLERCLVLEPMREAAPAGAELPYAAARDAWQRWFERQYLTDLLDRCAGNISTAAQHAGMHRSHLYRLLVRAGLSP
jgi:DNA-binding NtrC family response regulator